LQLSTLLLSLGESAHSFIIRLEWNITFDGDTASFNAVYTDEAVKEVQEYLNSKAAYVDPRGGLKASANVATVALVLRNMTG